MKIHFKPFRREPIEWLVAQCKRQHGLLLNHTMGTGKTMTSVLLLANYPEAAKVIVAPRNTHADWDKTIAAVGREVVGRYELQDIRRLPQIPKGAIVVVDEAHNLLGRLREDPEPLRAQLGRARKLLLLTGTPIRESLLDLGLLVNLAAGKEVVPVLPSAFQREFGRISVAKAAAFGWVRPGVAPVFSIVRGFWVAVVSDYVLSWFIKYFRAVLTLRRYPRDGLSYEEGKRIIWEKMKTLLSETKLPEREAGEGVEVTEAVDRILRTKAVTESMVPLLYYAMGYTDDGKERRDGKPARWSQRVGKGIVDGGLRLQRAVSTAPRLLAGTAVLYAVHLLLANARRVTELVTLDTRKLAEAIGPYVHTFDPFLQNATDVLRHFPKVEETQVRVGLTRDQVRMLYRMLTDRLTAEDFAALGLPARRRAAYLDEGRAVSSAVVSSSSQPHPPKFERIFAMHQGSRQPTLVYSAFAGAIRNFRRAARERGFRTAYLPTADRKRKAAVLRNRRLDFILLPPHAVEGTDAPGIRRFHILEPPADVIAYQQLRARVIRYTDGPRYTVQIVVWLAALPGVLTRASAFLRFWQRHGKQTVPWVFREEVKDGGTSPDEAVWREVSAELQRYKKLQLEIIRWGREREQKGLPRLPRLPRLRCCPYGDPACEGKKKPCAHRHT